MDGDTIIAKILRAEGVEWMTCYPYQTLIEAGAKEGIRPIVCRQERAGVNMADGFSRISNGKRVGVFTMQRGPGAENAFGGVAQAFADSVPLLLFPGGEPAGRQGVPPTFGATRNYEGITKWSAHVNMVERIPEMLSRAFTNLRHGRRGPVLLEVPQDVASAEFPGDTFHYSPVTESKSAADPDDVRDLVKALLAAADPVINAGQGVLYAEATDELVEFAELTGIPVMTTLAGKSAYPENHPLALGTGSHSATLMVDHFLRKTDFVLGMGTSFTISNFNAPMPSGVTLAHSTNCPEDLNKDYRVAYGAIGDSKLVLKQMIEEAKRQTDGAGRSAAGSGRRDTQGTGNLHGGVGAELHVGRGAHQPVPRLPRNRRRSWDRRTSSSPTTPAIRESSSYRSGSRRSRGGIWDGASRPNSATAWDYRWAPSWPRPTSTSST